MVDRVGLVERDDVQVRDEASAAAVGVALDDQRAAEVGDQRFEPWEGPGQRVAVGLGDRRVQRDGLCGRRQRLDLGAVPDRAEAVARARLVERVAAGGFPFGELLAAGRDRHPDPDDGVLAAPDAVAELDPGLEPGDPCRVGHGEGDQQLVGQAYLKALARCR